MSFAEANSLFLPLMEVTLCFIELSDNTRIWLFFPLYGSHMCDDSVEKYLFILLDQSLLSSKQYASCVSTKTMLMHWWTRLSWDNKMIMSRSSPMASTNVQSSWMIHAEIFSPLCIDILCNGEWHDFGSCARIHQEVLNIIVKNFKG